MANTPVRAIRIDDDRWDLIGEWADRNNWTASDAIRELIDRLATTKTPHEKLAEQAATLARLDTIHLPQPHDPFCQECGHGWPCLTYRVLQGIEP